MIKCITIQGVDGEISSSTFSGRRFCTLWDSNSCVCAPILFQGSSLPPSGRNVDTHLKNPRILLKVRAALLITIPEMIQANENYFCLKMSRTFLNLCSTWCHPDLTQKAENTNLSKSDKSYF